MVLASEQVARDKDGEPIYVRFVSDYVPVGCEDNLGFKEGDVVMVRKLYDAYYFQAGPTPSRWAYDNSIPTMEEMKEQWVKSPGRLERVRRDKVEVVSQEEAITFAMAQVIKHSTTVDRILARRNSTQAVSEIRKEKKRGGYGGFIYPDGRVIDADGNYAGTRTSDGRFIRSDGSYGGFVYPDGRVIDANGNYRGTQLQDGRFINSDGSHDGFVYPDGRIIFSE